MQVFDPDSTEESDDAEEETQVEGHGYEPINQEEAFGDGSEELEEEKESMEDEVAADGSVVSIAERKLKVGGKRKFRKSGRKAANKNRNLWS